jgi:hypothetical protein
VKSFRDHFSSASGDYARYRPRYPEELYDFLAAQAARRKLAWDCATGSGQSARALARRFDRVVATDASTSQLAHAAHVPNVEYRVAPAERSGLEPRSVDLVTVAQALHWLDFDPFYGEVRRVAAPAARIAAWSYNLCRVAPAIDEILDEFALRTLEPYWPPERRWVAAGYATIPFPFRAVKTPGFRMEARWTADEMLGYVGTWSAVLRYARATGDDPLGEFAPQLRARWGNERRPVRWPLVLKLGALAD